MAARYAREIGDELAGKPLDRGMLNAFAELAVGPVLDVGGGPGHVAAYLVQRGVAVASTDLSPRMCSLAAQSGLPAFAADMTALPVASGVVGGIVCLYAVIHLAPGDREVAYAAFRRVLRPGGVALIAFHTRDADNEPGGETTLTTL